MSSDEPETDPLIGIVVEKYVIERRIGAGGMGVVYFARHESLGTPAAIKTLNIQSLQDPVARERFLREAQALARVQDEGLVHIRSIGTLPDGRPYILMEFLDGQTLATHLADSEGDRLSIEQALRFTKQIATTLGTLHVHRIVHRDIKPANIMLVEDPVVPGQLRTKLLDFGIAKLLEANSDLTRNANQIPGTPAYMAPECCEGKPADGKADVYSLGCVLYQMLCGRTPYLEDGGNMLAKHIFQRPVPPHLQTRAVPRAVSEFVLELLARYPVDRVSPEVAATRAGELLVLPASTAWRGRWLWRSLWQHLRHHRRGIGIACLTSMLLLALSLLIWFRADWLVGVGPPWFSRLFLHSTVVRVPEGTYTSGTSSAENDIVWGMAKELDARYPQELGENTKELADNRYLDREAVQRTISLPSFLIDRYEVTNEQFAQFLNKQLGARRVYVDYLCSGGTDRKAADSKAYVCNSNGMPYKNLFNDPRYGGISFDENKGFVAAPGSSRRPVVSVTWQAAADFCAASGMRLPSEAEWEYVARRGGRRFPWGDRFPSCQDSVLERKRDSKLSHCVPNEGDVLPDVGSMPNDKSEDGVFDMGGSVMEWTLDWFVERLPASDQTIRFPLVDLPPSREDKPMRVIRGGGWTESVLSARGTGRSRARPDAMNAGIGFRCVRELR